MFARTHLSISARIKTTSARNFVKFQKIWFERQAYHNNLQLHKTTSARISSLAEL